MKLFEHGHLMNRNDIRSKLVLATIMMSAWEESVAGGKVLRAWKGYPFEVLNVLEEAGFISQVRKGKSLYLTDQGKQQALQILKEYCGWDGKE